MQGQGEVNMLGHEGDIGMKHLQDIHEDVIDVGSGVLLDCFIFRIEGRFDRFDVPVAEFAPDEIVQLSAGKTDLVFLQVLVYRFRRFLQAGQDPLVCDGFFCLFHRQELHAFEIHHYETRGIPNLVDEVSRAFDLFFVEAGVTTGGDAVGKGEAEGVGAVLVDDQEGVDAVAEALAHLSAQFIAHDTVNHHF